MFIKQKIFFVSFLVFVGCSGSNNGTQDGSTSDGTSTDPLTITITSPTADAQDISVSDPVLIASFNRTVQNAEAITAKLTKDSVNYYGWAKYEATELRVVFYPFNTLQSNSTYTFSVSAEGKEASVTFTTQKTNAGSLPDLENKTFAFGIEELSYPTDLGTAFNPLLKTAPPVLMHFVSVTKGQTIDSNEHGTFIFAGTTGTEDAEPGQAQPALREDGTSTSMYMEGKLEGKWMGAGPSDLHITASGIPLVIRDFYLTGIVADDGNSMSSLRLTGVVDPKDIGNAFDVDLSGLCNNAAIKKYCDTNGRIRVAAGVNSILNPINFSAFIVSPVNAAENVDTSTTIKVFFNDEVDEAATTVTLSTGGLEIDGNLTFGTKSAVVTPTAALTSATEYLVEVFATIKNGVSTDERKTTFTTK